MLKKKILLAACGLVAMAMATPALAVMSVPFGWYLEGNVGSSHLSNVNYSGSSSSSGVGGNANLGYKFMPYFAMEAGYTQYANSSIKDNTGTKAASVKHYSYDLAGRGIFPITDSGFELFAKLGVQRINAKTSISDQTAANNLGISSSQHNTTGLYLGAGGQYYMMPELAVNVQWQRAQGNSNSGTEDLYSVGLSFIFD
ncbi:MAG: outer membrane beta-barrel protein [Gammaproteobacteria bacterium]